MKLSGYQMKKRTEKSVLTNCCPTCQSENIERHMAKETIIDRSGQAYVLDSYEYSTCSACGTEFVTAPQARSNEKQFADARRKEQGLLSTERIADIRRKLKLRQEDASQIFGGGANAFSKYELGYVTQSVAMDRLLRVAEKYPDLVLPFLKELAGLECTVKLKIVAGHADKESAKGRWLVTENASTLRATNFTAPTSPTKRRVGRSVGSRQETYTDNMPKLANG